MTIKAQLMELIKAQDMIRQVYVQHEGNEAEKRLKELDKQLSAIINLIGKEI